MKRLATLIIAYSLLNSIFAPFSFAQTGDRRLVTLDDMAALADVSDPQLSPEGEWIAYTVSRHNAEDDEITSDIWMSSWDGARHVRLTSSKASEHSPRWSPDRQFIAFLSSRDVEEETDQLWLLNRAGGEAEQLTELKGGVSDFVFSPDGKRIALVVKDPDPDAPDPKAKDEKKTPKPIVIDRYQFKLDEEGFLGKRRTHLSVLDLATRKTEQLTEGNDDEVLPSWSPDGAKLAFVSKRGSDADRHDNYDIYTMAAKPNAKPAQVTTFDGGDCDPTWGSRPAWSPDGKTIAYIQGGAKELIYYATYQLALIPASGGQARLLMPTLDRNTVMPQWSADGSSIYCLIEDDRVFHLAKVNVATANVERVAAGRRYVGGYDVNAAGRLVALVSTPQAPYEVFAVEANGLRALTKHNQELMAKLKLGAVEEISFPSKDGTTINGFIVKPHDYRAGRRYPTILRIHGGPVWQFYNEFHHDWQYFAARGYVVVACNPRGSSGRGQEFAKAIYADWGNKDAQDVLAAVDYAVAQGISDKDRLGVGGWSYGGILTNYVIAQDTRFKAAVSGSGISNILAGYGTDMYIREYEYELGTPWKNTDVWLKLSFPFLKADRITTPTLFLCGERDFNVPLLNSEQMYQALRSLGRDTQLIIYPEQYHEINKPSYLRDRLERYVAWYDKYLMPKAANANANK